MATGFAPAEILLGRPLVWPIEFKKKEVDFTGTKMTKTLVDSLMQIHNKVFGIAAQNIVNHQQKYKKKFDKKMNAKKFWGKRRMKVQYKIHKSKCAKTKFRIKWTPSRSYLIIHSIDWKKKKVKLKTREGKILKHTKTFDKLRKYAGVF